MNFRRLFALFFVLILMLPLGGAAQEAGQFEAESVLSVASDRIAVTMEPDGSAQVAEEMTYRINGRYAGVMVQFDTAGTDGIDGIKISVDGSALLRQSEGTAAESGTYSIDQLDDMLYIVMNTPGEDDERVFRFEYRIGGFARRYLDAARIDNFKVIAICPSGIENALVTIKLPGSGKPGYYFLHGAMGMEDMTLDAEGTLTLGPKRVPPGECVELDALFPAEWLKDAPVIQKNVMADALQAEAALADEKNTSEGPYCTDTAGILSSRTEQRINENAGALEQATGVRIAFVTVKSTFPVKIEDYAKILFDARNIGGKSGDDSILVLMAVSDGEYCVQEGPLLETLLPARPLRAMWNQYLAPDFVNRDFNAASVKFFDALFSKLSDLLGANLTISGE